VAFESGEAPVVVAAVRGRTKLKTLGNSSEDGRERRYLASALLAGARRESVQPLVEFAMKPCKGLALDAAGAVVRDNLAGEKLVAERVQLVPESVRRCSVNSGDAGEFRQ
jgi:tRNA(Met) C34 N-acetyltransferase TmcA